jgi:hypothetical protein
MASHKAPAGGASVAWPSQPSTITTPIIAPPVRPGDRRRNPQWRARLEQRARAEFAEMPGLHLSMLQAQRLFGLRADICQRILDTLVREGFLAVVAPGVYARRDQH